MPDDDDEDPNAGLAEGFWREGDGIWTMAGIGRGLHQVLLCSDIRAVRKVSAGDGLDWAVIVGFKDSRKVDKEVRISCDDAATDPSKCIHELAAAGLLIHVEDPKLYRLVLKAVVHAVVPLAYRLVKAGWFPIAATHVFALPSGVIPRFKEEVIWGGDRNYCRALQRGSMDRWRETVLKFANGNWLVMACYWRNARFARNSVSSCLVRKQHNGSPHRTDVDRKDCNASRRCYVMGGGLSDHVAGIIS